MEITDQHKSHRWKFLVGGVVLSVVSAIDDFLRADTANSGRAFVDLIYSLPVGLLVGYGVWFLWAKTKKLDSDS